MRFQRQHFPSLYKTLLAGVSFSIKLDLSAASGWADTRHLKPETNQSGWIYLNGKIETLIRIDPQQ